MSTKQKVPDLFIQYPSEETLSALEKTDWFLSAIYDNLYMTLKKSIKSEYVNLFHVNHSGYCVKLERDQYGIALDSAISYYEKMEDFEKCQNLLDVKLKINENPRRQYRKYKK